MDTLREAIDSSQFRKVFGAAGYDDLDMPCLTAQSTMDHLNPAPGLRGSVTMHYCRTGIGSMSVSPRSKSSRSMLRPL